MVVFASEGGGSAGDGGEGSPRRHDGHKGLHILDQGTVVSLWFGVHNHIKRPTGNTFTEQKKKNASGYNIQGVVYLGIE